MNNFGRIINSKEFAFPGRFSFLETIRSFVTQMSRSAGFDEDNCYRIELAVDEACSNIIEHAYHGESDKIIECTCIETEKALLIQLKDFGTSFNPKHVPIPQLDSDLSKRKPGGLGLHFIRKYIDKVEYNSPSAFNEQVQSKSGNYLLLVKFKDELNDQSD